MVRILCNVCYVLDYGLCNLLKIDFFFYYSPEEDIDKDPRR